MSIDFKNIIDTNKLQKMMAKFYRATQIPIGIIDIDGNILVSTGWQDICTKFHRVNPRTEKHCFESDNFINGRIHKEKYVQYKCKNGLWDIAIPIIVGKKHMANLFVGQFFYEDENPDIEFFKTQAIEFGFDVEEYLEALTRVRIFSRKKIQEIVDFYADFASFISDLAYRNMQLKEDVKKLEGLIPICAKCKKIRDDKGYWSQIESYIENHSDASFSHGLCEECSDELYGDKDWYIKMNKRKG